MFTTRRQRCFRARTAVSVISLALALSASSSRIRAAENEVEPPHGSVLIRTRSVRIFVEDVDAAKNQLLDELRSLGAQLERQSGARIDVRVTEPQLEALLERLTKIGELRADSGSTEDATARAFDLESSIRATERSRQELMSLSQRARNVQESLLVERRVGELDGALARLRAERRELDRRAQRTTLSIDLISRPVESLPGFTLPFPWLRTLSARSLSQPPEPEPPARKLTSNVDISVDIQGRMLRDRPAPDEDSRTLGLAMRIRGAGTDPVGFSGGYDIALGGGQGFVYELRFLGGVGSAAGSVLTLGLLGGLGVSGWTGDRVPSSIELPVELFLLIDFGESLRLSLFGQPLFALTREARHDGAEHAWIADELSLGGALLVPPIFGSQKLEFGGLRVAFEYRELMDTFMYLASIGVGFGLPRTE